VGDERSTSGYENTVTATRQLLVAVYRRQPNPFHHWRIGARPEGWTVGAV
jgi:hypothetical protein